MGPGVPGRGASRQQECPRGSSIVNRPANRVPGPRQSLPLVHQYGRPATNPGVRISLEHDRGFGLVDPQHRPRALQPRGRFPNPFGTVQRDRRQIWHQHVQFVVDQTSHVCHAASFRRRLLYFFVVPNCTYPTPVTVLFRHQGSRGFGSSADAGRRAALDSAG